jgi:hypothetical protein
MHYLIIHEISNYALADNAAIIIANRLTSEGDQPVVAASMLQ